MFLDEMIRQRGRPCPSDFPPKLVKYWKDNLEYSLTPIQHGWIQYYADIEKVKRLAVKKTTKSPYY